MTNWIIVRLPSRRTVRVCHECAADYPEHQYFCSSVEGYKREQLLRELVRVDEQLAAAKEPRWRAILRGHWWGWAWWLQVEPFSDKAARDDLRTEIGEARARITRKKLEDAAA